MGFYDNAFDNSLQAKAAGFKPLFFSQSEFRAFRTYHSWGRFSMCSPPFDCSPSRCSHRWLQPSFSIFQASTLFSFYLSCYSMAEPRVLVLGDSFIRRLRLFLSRDSYHFSVDFKLSHRAFIKWHGVGGRTVSKTLHLDLNVIESFRPEIVILHDILERKTPF